jgi:hypothetical protein
MRAVDRKGSPHARAAVVAGVLVAAGCADAARDTAPRERRILDVAIDTVWSRGGVSDTVIELPLHMRADGDLLLIADGARRGVAALRTADGSTVWTAGRRGEGPGEFQRPAIIETHPDGRILVADTEVGRITALDRTGAWAGEFPLEDAQVSGMCALADGSVVVAAVTEGENIALLEADGRVLAKHVVPWPELQSASQLARQLVLATPADRAGCVVALSLGRGLGSFAGGRFAWTRDYIEPVAAPEVAVRESGTDADRSRVQALRRPTLSTRAIAASEDHVYVVFEGSTADAGRVVDVYTLAGAYDHSFRLPRRAQEIAWADGVLYLLAQDQGVPVVTAARIRRSP